MTTDLVRRARNATALSIGAWVFLAPAVVRAELPPTVELRQAELEIPAEQLLDVGVVIFDIGLPPENEDPEVEDKLEEKGIYRDVRRAEARFFPTHLANTLQLSGHVRQGDRTLIVDAGGAAESFPVEEVIRFLGALEAGPLLQVSLGG